jgi:hypothetical protein
LRFADSIELIAALAFNGKRAPGQPRLSPVRQERLRVPPS